MNWIKVDEELPPVHPDTGESEFVFCYLGNRFLPVVMKYSDGTRSARGWWDTSFRHYPVRGKNGLVVTHWSEIEYPNE